MKAKNTTSDQEAKINPTVGAQSISSEISISCLSCAAKNRYLKTKYFKYIG